MPELLKFEYLRIKKSVFFWVLLALSALIPIITTIVLHIIVRYILGESGGFLVHGLKNTNVKFLNWFVISSMYKRIPYMIALFAPLLIGKDYKDGVIRNKLTAGHTRFQIFTSAVITQCSVTAVFSIVYILASVIALAFSNIKVNLNHGELLLRACSLILCMLATTILFTAISLLIRSRAGTIVICIAFIIISGVVANVANYFNYNHEMIEQYGEIYEEKVTEISGAEFDEKAYFNAGWYIGHPLFVLTNATMGSEILVDGFAGIGNILFESDLGDLFSYPTKIYRTQFYNLALSIVTGDYAAAMISFDDLKNIDGVEVKVSDALLWYNIKSVIWAGVYFGGGYALFRKKNLF